MTLDESFHFSELYNNGIRCCKDKVYLYCDFFFNFFYVTLHLGYENLEKCSIKRNVSSRLMKNVSTAASGNLSAKG